MRESLRGPFPWRSFFLLFLLSGLLHLLVVLPFLHYPIVLDDMYQYDMLARSLKEGRGYRWYSRADMAVLRPYYSTFLDLEKLDFPEEGIRTAFRAPGYPAMLAAIYHLGDDGSRFAIARVSQALLAGLTAALAALLGWQAGLPQRKAIWAGVFTSFYPILLAYPAALASENLYIPLALLTLTLLLGTLRRQDAGVYVAAGLAAGALLLTRSVFAVFVGLAGLWLAMHSRRRWQGALLFACAAGLLVFPWAVRNSLLAGRPVFVELNTGISLYVGYHPEGDGGFVSRIAIPPMNLLEDAARDQDCLDKAERFILADPVEAMRRVGRRVGWFLGPEDREFFYLYGNNQLGEIPQPWLLMLYAALVIPWLATLCLGLVGLSLLPLKPVRWLILLVLLGYTLPHLLFLAEPRFHLALVPVLMPCAVEGWAQRKAFFQGLGRSRCRKLWAVAILGVLVAFAWALAGKCELIQAVMRAGGNHLAIPY